MEMDQPPASISSDGETSSVEKREMNNSCEPEFLEYLSRAYGVLRKIFSYLYLEDIENAAAAFDSWKPVAEVTRNERSSIESFVVSDQKYKMSKIWSEAVFCISFCTVSVAELHSKVTKFLDPSGEHLHCLSGAGVIGTVHDLSHIVQQKVRVGLSLPPEKFCMTALRLPRVAKFGVKIYVWEEDMDFAEFKSKFDIPSDQVVKCLLILMVAEGISGRVNLQKDDFINFLQCRQKENFAIGGCVVDDFVNNSRRSDPHSVTKYIVFFGDNVEAASTVLTAEINSVSRIDCRILNLKEMCRDTKRGALFVFRCAGRQRVIKGPKLVKDITKWEGEALQKYFPSTPIVGCFGYGEFGRDHPYQHSKPLQVKRLKRSKWEHNFSTSIVYIGFMK